VLKAAEVRHNSQFANAALLLQRMDLANHFLRRADESYLLLKNLIVTKFGQRLQSAAGVKTVTFSA